MFSRMLSGTMPSRNFFSHPLSPDELFELKPCKGGVGFAEMFISDLDWAETTCVIASTEQHIHPRVMKSSSRNDKRQHRPEDSPLQQSSSSSSLKNPRARDSIGRYRIDRSLQSGDQQFTKCFLRTPFRAVLTKGRRIHIYESNQHLRHDPATHRTKTMTACASVGFAENVIPEMSLPMPARGSDANLCRREWRNSYVTGYGLSRR